MRTVEEYLNLPYTIMTIKADDGSYFIAVKELEGCMSVGDTIDDAYFMIKDAMRLWISVALEDGQTIPEPEILTEEKTYSGKFVLRTPEYLHKELSEKAEENGVSLNTYAISLLSRRCGIIEMKDKIIHAQNELLTEHGAGSAEAIVSFNMKDALKQMK